jgi:RNA-directed DNA polymerase
VLGARRASTIPGWCVLTATVPSKPAGQRAVCGPVLREWGNYFRTGNATDHFQRLDRYVTMRLVRLMGAKHGWQRRPFQVRGWNYRRFVADFGLHKLLGTIRYPGGAHAA